jgi:release factor glutamine methyltransferase
MRRLIFKALLNPVARPLVKWYLSKERSHSWKGIHLKIPACVFHPGLFYSTRFMLSFLEHEDVKAKTLLEIGAGSGLISIYMAKQGAIVTATDISSRAVKTIGDNAALNKADIRVIESDLFLNIEKQAFDYIVINPPYYKGSPRDEADFAWKAGENLEYFQRFFNDLNHYIHTRSRVLMVLSEDADIDKIKNIALSNSLHMNLLRKKNIMFEWHFIFSISQ